MPFVGPFTLGKGERIYSRTLIEKLFNGSDRKSFSAYPLRVVYTLVECKEQNVPVKMMVSVSKKHFKRAVKRNRVKRQIREGYRLQKQLVMDAMNNKPNQQLLLAFIWLADDIYDTRHIAQQVRRLLNRIVEKV